MNEQRGGEHEYLITMGSRLLNEISVRRAEAIARVGAARWREKVMPPLEAVTPVSRYLTETPNSDATQFLDTTPLITDNLYEAIQSAYLALEQGNPSLARKLNLFDKRWPPKELREILYSNEMLPLRTKATVAWLRLSAFLPSEILGTIKDAFANELHRDYRFVGLPIPPHLRLQAEKVRRNSSTTSIDDALADQGDLAEELFPDHPRMSARAARRDERLPQMKKMASTFPDSHQLIEELLESPFRPKQK